MPVTLTDANALCTTTTLGEVLGVTDRRVRQLTKDGVLKCARTKLAGMSYHLGDSVQRFLKHQRQIVSKQCGANNGEYEAERTRRMRACASMAELELKAKQGLYLNRDDVGFSISQMLVNCRNRLLAVPSRLMHRMLGLTDAREANRLMDDEIRLALTEVSEGKFRQSLAFKRAEAKYLRSQGFDDATIVEMQSNGQEPTDAD